MFKVFISLAACVIAAAGSATAQTMPALAGDVVASPAAFPQETYPAKAKAEGVTGSAVVECNRNGDDKTWRCMPVRETPPGWGFGDAAAEMAQAQLARWPRPGETTTLATSFGPPFSYADVLRAVEGERYAAKGLVQKGEVIFSMPYAYRRTGVLTQDVTGYSIFVKGVVAPAGSPGHFAGAFGSGDPRYPRQEQEVWCFFPPAPSTAKDVCLMFAKDKPDEKLAAILPNLNPHLIVNFAPMTGSFNYAYRPTIDETAVSPPQVLRLEYRLGRWSKKSVSLEEWVDGRKGESRQIARNDDGTATLNTPAGGVKLRQAGADDGGAEVTLLYEIGPEPSSAAP